MPLKAVFMTALTDTWTDAAKGDPVGSLRFDQGNWYKCVKYVDATVFCTLGGVLSYLQTTGPAASTVTADDTDNHGIAAGVAMATITVTNTFMWIQLSGVYTLTTALQGGTTAGFALSTEAATNDESAIVRGDYTEVYAGATIVDADNIILCRFPIF